MDWRNPHFAEPAWLWIALIGPVLVLALYAWATRQRRRQLHTFAAPALTPHLTRSLHPGRRAFRQGLLALASVLLGVSLARPQWGVRLEQPETLGEDVLFLVDSSRSMLATDVAPNRRIRAALAVLDFVERHGRGRVGLVGFAGQAFLLCPLTFDYDAFREALLALDENTIPVPGTDLGRALDEGFLAMEKGNRRKILVLLTDGEDLEGRGVAAAEALARQQVVVFTIGVGTLVGANIPFRTAQNLPDLMRDARGQVVQSRLDETTLQAIARVTGGDYHPLGIAGQGMAAIRRMLESPEFDRRFSQTRALGVDRFHLIVALLIAVLVIESLIPLRRAARPARSVSPVTVLSQGAPGVLAALLLLSSRCAAVTAPVTNSVPAEPDLARSSARELFNLGSKRLLDDQLRDAESALFQAVRRDLESIQPAALYNLGHVRFRQGQEALATGPDARANLNQGRAAHERARQVLGGVDTALESPDLNEVVRAYLQGRGARKELKAARDAVRAALENHRGVLLRWQRAAGDFRSADELDPAEDARHNAEVVERHLARLVDLISALQLALQSLNEGREQLRQRLELLKGRLPFELQQQLGPNGDDDERNEPGDQRPLEEPQPGLRERESRTGQSLPLTPEEATHLLNSLKLDAQRKLPMGTADSPKPDPRRGRDW